MDIRRITPRDEEWPRKALQGVSDVPRALWVAGRLPPQDRPALAVVGTRAATPYGRRLAREIARDLASRGCWIVSGLALGIDAVAHEAALDAACPDGVLGDSGGGTLAVLGCGLDVRYPVENLALKDRIAREGGIVTEHPPGTPPLKHHFPRRNRLVAAFSEAVVVVEAGAKSGALITARLANDLGRGVFAVPGPAGRPSHAGCHLLLRRGLASLLECGADALKDPGAPADGPGATVELPPPPPGPQLALWTALDLDEAADADELCRRTGLPASAVARALTALELAGRVLRAPGGYRRT